MRPPNDAPRPHSVVGWCAVVALANVPGPAIVLLAPASGTLGLVVAVACCAAGNAFFGYRLRAALRAAAQLAAAPVPPDEAVRRARDELLLTLNHDLRTPLNGVLGAADLLASTPLDDEQRRLVETLIGSSEALLRSVERTLERLRDTDPACGCGGRASAPTRR